MNLATLCRNPRHRQARRSYRPRDILFVSDLPKTRNMKIMRRVVRSVILGEEAGDLSSLVNPEAADELRAVAGK